MAFICVFAAMSVTVNAANPALVSNCFSQVPLGTIMETQNIFQVYSRMAVIPVNVVSRLFGEKFSSKDLSKRPAAPAKKESRGAQRASDVSFVPPRNAANPVRFQAGNSLQAGSFDGWVDGMPLDYYLKFLITGFKFCATFMFILTFLITLRRSSLPAPNSRSLTRYITRSSGFKMDRVFYLRRSR